MTKKKIDGVAVVCDLSVNTRKLIGQFIADWKVPNGLKASDLHVTIIYDINTDFTSVQIKPKRYQPPMSGKPSAYEVVDEGTTLILVFDCPRLDRRHQELKTKYDLSHSHVNFKSHITLSYNKGDNFDVSNLVLFNHSIEIVGDNIARVEN